MNLNQEVNILVVSVHYLVDTVVLELEVMLVAADNLDNDHSILVDSLGVEWVGLLEDGNEGIHLCNL